MVVCPVPEARERGGTELAITVLARRELGIVKKMRFPGQERQLVASLLHASKDDRPMLVAVRAVKMAMKSRVVVGPDPEFRGSHCSLAHACIWRTQPMALSCVGSHELWRSET